MLRVFRLGLRVAIPPKLCCDSPQLSPLRLATCLMVSGHFSTPCLCCPRSKHYRRRVRSPLTKPIARPPCRRSCRCSEPQTLSCSCRLDALVRLTELTELTALMPVSIDLCIILSSHCTLRPPLQRTPSLPWIHVVTRIAPPCFTRLRFQLRLSSRDPQDFAKRVRQTRSIGAAWLGSSG